MGGDYWDKWNKVMRQAVPEHQVKEGREKGSWDPLRDRWGNHGGRLYTTCLSCLMLEAYYRHLPIYKPTVPTREKENASPWFNGKGNWGNTR